MEEASKKNVFFKRMKWLGPVPGAIMYYCTADSFGDIIACALGCLAAIGFYMICLREEKRIVCEYVATDIKNAVKKVGDIKCRVEIKPLDSGLITRVYFIGAGEKIKIYTGAVISHIRQSGYSDKIWITQMIDLKNEAEIKEARLALNEELLDHLEEMKNNSKNKDE